MEQLQVNLTRIRERVTAAAQRSGRDPKQIQIVAVTKGHPPERISQALAAGMLCFGENRVQEAITKQQALELSPPQLIHSKWPQVQWHLLGHVQTNKAKKIARSFHTVHSVDSQAVVEALARHRRDLNSENAVKSPLEVFVQVNVSGEATKTGCKPEQVQELVRSILDAPELQLRGLMTMAPYTQEQAIQRAVFSKLRALRDGLEKETGRALELSMGMSDDFEIAVEEGADVVRLGTALFGNRTSQ